MSEYRPVKSNDQRYFLLLAAALAMGALLVFGVAACLRPPDDDIGTNVKSGIASDTESGESGSGIRPAESGSAVYVIRTGSLAPLDYQIRWPERELTEDRSSCLACHETLSRRWGRPARDHVRGAHSLAAVSCADCHGGDANEDEPDFAHSLEANFAGRLDSAMMIDRCARCHERAVETFVGSKHQGQSLVSREVTCVVCHGAHDIGAGSRPASFSWKKTCNDCHALDSVPNLPDSLVSMLTEKDALDARLRELRRSIAPGEFPSEITEKHRAIRQRSSDIVHATRAENIAPATAEIAARTAALIERIENIQDEEN